MPDLVIARFDYNATSNFGTPFRAGEVFTLIEKSNAEWSRVMRNDRSVIYVPANYVAEFNPPSSPDDAHGSFPNGDVEAGQLCLTHTKAPTVGNPSSADGFQPPVSSIVRTRNAHSLKQTSASKVPVSHRMSLPVNNFQPANPSANLQQNRRFSSHVTVSPPHSPTPDVPEHLSTSLTEEGRAIHELRSDVAGIDSGRIEGVVGPRMSGYLSRKGICGAGGKKTGHRWAQFYCVLIDNHLNFFKDKKTAQNLKNNTLPLHTFPLQDSAIAAVQEHRKKHVFQLTASTGEVIYCQADSQAQYDNWTSVIGDVLGAATSFSSPAAANVTDVGRSMSTESGDTACWEYVPDTSELQEESEASDKGRIKKRLVHFFSRRPPPEAIASLVKDQYFGVPLQRLCERERRYVPNFVEQCIGAIEQRGLDLVGIYRLSGNASQVQRLRYMVDHDEPLEQIFGKVEDVNILTGTLKLFLRELPEPIIPFNLFDIFIAASKIQEQADRLHAFADAIRRLPLANFHTLNTLCVHLRRVTDLNHVNKMQVANIAIVFGPTLMRPQVETMSMAIDLVHQSNIVEHFLREYKTLFPDH